MTRDEMLALKRAHEAAEQFHRAMAEALEAEYELAEPDEEYRDPEFWEPRRAQATGEASEGLRKMPEPWAAILGKELATIIPGVIPAHTSVYLAAE